jgi:glycosyltransferase involved in cell wall biosynthesis
VSSTKGSGGIGYVLRKFPVLSETFVLNEILALEDRELPIHIFSLAPTRDPRFHDNLPKLKAPVLYVPGVTDPSERRTLVRHNRTVARRFPKRYYRELLRVLSTGRPSYLWRFFQSGYVADKARQLGVGHLHAHFAKRATNAALLASRITGIPYSFTAHAVDIFQNTVSTAQLTRKMRGARFVVTVSDFNKAYLESLLNGTPARIVRVYNGVDLERFAPGEPPSGPFTILAVARLVEKKGLGVLVEACRLLRDEGLAFRCSIIGKGAERPRLDRLVRQWDLGDRVHFLGALAQQEVVDLYRRAHLFVLPSIVAEDGNREGLPVSIVEALACGLPVVSTSVTGIPEVVRDGENGFCVPPHDASALASAIAAVMRDEALRARLCSNARASIAARFDESETTAALWRLFQGEVA